MSVDSSIWRENFHLRLISFFEMSLMLLDLSYDTGISRLSLATSGPRTFPFQADNNVSAIVCGFSATLQLASWTFSEVRPDEVMNLARPLLSFWCHFNLFGIMALLLSFFRTQDTQESDMLHHHTRKKRTDNYHYVSDTLFLFPFLGSLPSPFILSLLDEMGYAVA
jgi:hypothetical protein